MIQLSREWHQDSSLLSKRPANPVLSEHTFSNEAGSACSCLQLTVPYSKKHTNKHTTTQTNRQKNKQTDRQTDRQTD